MRLTILGCHGGETSKHRTTSFLIDQAVALDAGAITGSLSLREQRQIETVLVTHSHMDHVRDLAVLADHRCQQGGPELTIAATPETITALRTHFFNDVLWPDFTRIRFRGGGPTVRYKELTPEKAMTIGNLRVTAVPVHHTVDAAGFLVEGPKGTLGCTGDTGPTDRFWELASREKKLCAVLAEVAFPSDEQKLATESGHHTPNTLAKDLEKLHAPDDVAVLAYHIKPVFQARVERELARLRPRDLHVLQLGDEYDLEAG